MVSTRLGIVALLHAIFVISLPRIYVGYHYPTDILSGAVLGSCAAFVCKWPPFRQLFANPCLRWLNQHPASFYAFAFLSSFEIAELFSTLLNLQSVARKWFAA